LRSSRCIYTMHCGATAAWFHPKWEAIFHLLHLFDALWCHCYRAPTGWPSIAHVASIRCTVVPLLLGLDTNIALVYELHLFDALWRHCYGFRARCAPVSRCCIHSMHCCANVTRVFPRRFRNLSHVASIQCTVVRMLQGNTVKLQHLLRLHLFNALWCHCYAQSCWMRPGRCRCIYSMHCGATVAWAEAHELCRRAQSCIYSMHCDATVTIEWP